MSPQWLKELELKYNSAIKRLQKAEAQLKEAVELLLWSRRIIDTEDGESWQESVNLFCEPFLAEQK